MNVIRKNSLAAAGIVSILVAVLVIIGWVFHIPLLTSISPDFISMKFNTAFCFLFTGIALVMLGKKNGAHVCTGCLVLVLLISALTLTEYLFAINIGIDEFLWKEGPETPYTLYPGRPSALTALNFILLSIVLFNINSRKKFVLTWLALAVCLLVSVFSAISYVFGNPELVSIPSLTVLALHTALLFIIICLGIFYDDSFQHTALSFQRRMLAGFLTIAFMLLVVVFLDHKKDESVQSATADITGNTQAASVADDIITTLTRMKSREFGYLLTRDTILLGSFRDGRKEIMGKLKQLENLVAEHPGQKPRLDSLTVLLTTSINLLDSIMLLPRSVTIQPVTGVYGNLVRQAPLRMNQIIDLLRELKMQESGLLLLKQQAINSSKTQSDKLILFLGFCILAVFLLLVQFIFRNTNARIRAEAEARSLAATLEKKVAERTAQLDMANRQLHHLTEHLQRGREDERRQLAREVNDELGQLASAAKMNIDWLSLHLTDEDPKVSNRISHASTILQTMIDDVRKLASSLRPVMIDELGLNASVKWFCEQFSQTSGVPCLFTEELDDTTIPQTIRTELFRICQESIAHLVQYAKAREVNVILRGLDDRIELCITDNGNGTAVEQDADLLGLTGIQERVLSINGTFHIDTGQAKGTTILVSVPAN